MKKLMMLVRKNLKMTENKIGAQCAHAALGLYKKDPQEHWKCVVLDASDNKFNQAKLAHPEAYVVTDAGYTQVEAGSETVMAWWEEDV
jgi:peptidyl-tRNA hydrolase